MFDVICVGSNSVDTFVKTNFSELVKIMSPIGEEDLLAYPVGGKILIDQLEFTTGGGGTNVAVAFSRLGLKTSYMGCMGEDENADFVIRMLKKDKVNTDLVLHMKGRTGFSVILDSIVHDRTILSFKGVNNNFSLKDSSKKKLKTKWFYFASMLEKSFKELVKIAKFAEKNKIKIAFNPSSYLAEKGSNYLNEIISRLEIIILNKEEAALIVGADTIPYLCKKLHQLGPKYVVITDSKRGAYCYYDGFLYTSGTNNVKIVETTGAGDSFASTFVACIMMGRDVPFAMQMGTTNAESVISYHGAKNKLLTLRQAMNVHKKYKVKVTKKKI